MLLYSHYSNPKVSPHPCEVGATKPGQQYIALYTMLMHRKLSAEDTLTTKKRQGLFTKISHWLEKIKF